MYDENSILGYNFGQPQFDGGVGLGMGADMDVTLGGNVALSPAPNPSPAVNFNDVRAAAGRLCQSADPGS